MRKFIYLFLIIFLFFSCYAYAERENYSAPKIITQNQEIFLHLVIENELLTDIIKDKDIKSIYKSDLIIDNPKEEFYVAGDLIIWTLEGTVSKNNKPKDYKFFINIDNKIKKEIKMSLIDIEITSPYINSQGKFVGTFDYSSRIGYTDKPSFGNNIMPVNINIKNLPKEYEDKCVFLLYGATLTNQKGSFPEYLREIKYSNGIPIKYINNKNIYIQANPGNIIFQVKFANDNLNNPNNNETITKVYNCIDSKSICCVYFPFAGFGDHEIIVGNQNEKTNNYYGTNYIYINNTEKIDFKIKGDSVKFFLPNNKDIANIKDLTGENQIIIKTQKPGTTELSIIPSEFGIKRDLLFHNIAGEIKIENAKCTNKEKQEYEIENGEIYKISFKILGPYEKIPNAHIEVNIPYPYYLFTDSKQKIENIISCPYNKMPEYFNLLYHEFVPIPIPIEFKIYINETELLSTTKIYIKQKSSDR